MSLIVNMVMPFKCWDCEFFDDLYINFNGMEQHNAEMGWCRLCKKEVAHIDYKESKPGWCPLFELVRCKDCIHMGTDKCPSRLNDADFYCCQGERGTK